MIIKKTRNNNEAGLALLALIAIMLILGIVGYTFVSIISTERIASGTQYNSIKAFYITEGALEIGKKYISDQNGVTPDLAPDLALFLNEPLGAGKFKLSIHWPDSGFITLNAIANVD